MRLQDSITANDLERRIREHARYTLAREWEELEPSQIFTAVACATRDLVIEAALETERRIRSSKAKRIYYLSIEYLIGRSLGNNLRNLGLYDLCRTTLNRLGIELDDLLEEEAEAALGNGGLGRLAACFLDSMATMGYAGMGYGINYENGLFRQVIINGAQVEQPENWRAFGSPWLILRPEEAIAVPMYGRVVHRTLPDGRYSPIWTDWRLVLGVPSDLPIVGYGGNTVTYLRLYSAHSTNDLDLTAFGGGAYLHAVAQRVEDETISRVLYPLDAAEAGRELRLRQEYFFVACAVRDILRRYLVEHTDLRELPEHVAIHLNDTHPTLAIPEMMRLLVDDHGMDWDTAWDVTQRVFGYTNHTLMPEALESWAVTLLERVIPRHLLIIYEINRRFVEQVRARWPGDDEVVRRTSIVHTNGEARISMGALAVVGSHSINGVSELHSGLVRSRLFEHHAALWPERFHNKTNGVSPRRWILTANPDLANFLDMLLGRSWVVDLDRLEELEKYIADTSARDRFADVKKENKARLARYILDELEETVDPQSLFDVQVKRIHEYKRQILNLLRIADDYLRIVEDGYEPPVPRTYLFAGKAAVGYHNAKETIRAILALAKTVNRHARAKQHMRLLFLPDYRVTLAERIIPAADLSEQISLAGTEASGTGNMKLAMNGALTIGTRDGANIEIEEAVGAENAFMFGMSVAEVAERRRAGYRSVEMVQGNPRLRRVLEAFRDGVLTPKVPEVGAWVWHRLVDEGDEYMALADFQSYVEAQEHVTQLYCRRVDWQVAALRTVARMGRFSSDRTIKEYAADVWHARPAE